MAAMQKIGTAVDGLRYARDALAKRGIAEEWIERTLRQPQRSEADELDPVLEQPAALDPGAWRAGASCCG